MKIINHLLIIEDRIRTYKLRNFSEEKFAQDVYCKMKDVKDGKKLFSVVKCEKESETQMHHFI
jgi:hypothetical protein